MNFTVKTEIQVEGNRVVDLFISACEGGSNYWCKELAPKRKTGDAYEAMLYGFELIDGESGKKHLVSTADIHEALGLFAAEYPRHWSDFVQESDDAETGDVFLQLCVFKTVIYG